jgi:hypothetical protein
MSENEQFAVHHLRFEVEALTPLALPAYAGPSIRGALFGALQRHFCPAAGMETPGAEHKAICPVCWLMATEKPGHGRGRDVPRPYTVEPPLVEATAGALHLAAGERFTFGLTLFAQALNLFPYLVVATPLMGQAGLGLPLEENAPPGRRPDRGRQGDRPAARRGRFALRRIEAINPLTGEVAPVMGEGQTMVHMPEVPVTARDVAAVSRAMVEQLAADGRLQIHFRTPTRIVEKERLVHRPWLGPLFRRLLERLDALRGEFAGEPPLVGREELVALADRVRLVQDLTGWVDLHSGSRRLGRTTPVGGFAGTATYQADVETWQALLPCLLWGQEVHVGKNATKGDGWYEVRTCPSFST